MLTFEKLSKEQISKIDWSEQAITERLPAEQISLQSDSDETLFAAVLDDQIIALAALSSQLPSEPTPIGGVLNGIFVLPQYRRQGVGRMLVGLVAGAVMEMRAYFLRAQSPQTTEAKAFSDKIGFREESSFLVCLDLSDTKGLRQH